MGLNVDSVEKLADKIFTVAEAEKPHTIEFLLALVAVANTVAMGTHLKLLRVLLDAALDYLGIVWQKLKNREN